MSESSDRSRLARLAKGKADLEKKRAAALKKAAGLEDEAVRATSGITKHTSANSANQKRRTAADKSKGAGVERERAAKLEGEVANKVRDLGTIEQSLQREIDRQRKKDVEVERKRQRDEDKRTKDRDRKQAEDDRKRREADKRHARDMAREAERTARLSQPVLHAVHPRPAPTIKVLFLATSPEDQARLRLDHEVREIQEKIRATEHRESLELHWRPAVRTTDLLQALNEVQPHIVHFSGHGSQHFLVFEDQQGNSKPLTNDVLAGLLHATSDRIRLVIFNSCSSVVQAALATEYVDMAIGMNVSIGDEAAKVFAAQFYSSIGFGLSVAEAFEQAKMAIALAGLDEAETPVLHSADGVDVASVFLVRPGIRRAA